MESRKILGKRMKKRTIKETDKNETYNDPVLKGIFNFAARALIVGGLAFGLYECNSYKTQDRISKENNRLKEEFTKEYTLTLREKTHKKADTNGDNFISHREWSVVYKKLRPNEVYDVRDLPDYLSISEMENYLGIENSDKIFRWMRDYRPSSLN